MGHVHNKCCTSRTARCHTPAALDWLEAALRLMRAAGACTSLPMPPRPCLVLPAASGPRAAKLAGASPASTRCTSAPTAAATSSKLLKPLALALALPPPPSSPAPAAAPWASLLPPPPLPPLLSAITHPSSSLATRHAPGPKARHAAKLPLCTTLTLRSCRVQPGPTRISGSSSEGGMPGGSTRLWPWPAREGRRGTQQGAGT